MRNKRVISALIITVLISIIFIVYLSINITSRNSQNKKRIFTNIARWSFASKNENNIINLSDEKISPGSNGKFDLEVNATGSEVGVEYEVIVSQEKNIPVNMMFHAEIKNEQGGVIKTTNEYNSLKKLASENLYGEILPENNNQKRLITIYWDWKFNENDTSLIDSNDANLEYDKNENSSLDCGFDIEIVGRQIK